MTRTHDWTDVRTSHLIVPFGVGSIVLTSDRVSAVVGGANLWLLSRPDSAEDDLLAKLEIHDPVLERRLGVRRFVTPWAVQADWPSPSRDWIVPALRFPLAEACQNPKCGRLVHRSEGESKPATCQSCAPARGRAWSTVQVAVVRGCPAGHLDDLPWVDWVHAVGQVCARPDLRYRSGVRGNRPDVSCLCCSARLPWDEVWGESRCTGARPWLGGTWSPEQCSETMTVLERTSAAVYAADVVSSLTIPTTAADNPTLVRALERNPTLRTLASLTPTDEVVSKLVTTARQVGVRTDPAEVRRHVEARLAPVPATDAIRGPELTALTSERHRPRRTASPPDLIAEPQDISRYRDSRLGPLLSKVTLVRRMRETRVLAGFSRGGRSPTQRVDGYRQLWGTAAPSDFPKTAADDWLPGHQVFGEGVLLVLDPRAVDSWVSSVAGVERLTRQSLFAPGLPDEQRPLPWLLAHTLSHAVMRAVAPSSGYPLPSIRERIYAVDERTAVLVYTAAGDINGTLGGLVELGQPESLGAILDEALAATEWCATDPVCIEDSEIPGMRSTDAGACHHCLFAPETSCEAFNAGLDRAVLHGHEGMPGFIGDH